MTIRQTINTFVVPINRAREGLAEEIGLRAGDRRIVALSVSPGVRDVDGVTGDLVVLVTECPA